MKNSRKTKKLVDDSTSFFFLSGILQKSENFARHIDNQTSILIGLSSAIFILSISQIMDRPNSILFPFVVLSLFSLASALIAIFALIPPRFLRKRGQKESLLYNKKISNFCSSGEYEKELAKACRDLDKIIHEYATEIYNLSKYYYQPKRCLFKHSRRVLLAGIILSLIMMIAG